jgi:hypothetical protein
MHPAEVVTFHYGEVMLKDGFHLHIEVNRRVLSIVSKDKGKDLWIRDFIDDSSALAVFEDEVLGEDELARAYKTVGNGIPFFTKQHKEPKGGFSACGMSKYERTAP